MTFAVLLVDRYDGTRQGAIDYWRRVNQTDTKGFTLWGTSTTSADTAIWVDTWGRWGA